MDLKLDLTKAVKIVIAKDEKHHIEYILDNGEIKDVNIIEIDNSPVKMKEKEYETPSEPIPVKLDDRHFIDNSTPLAKKIISARETVSKVKEAISDLSNPAALHEMLDDGTTDEKQQVTSDTQTTKDPSADQTWKERWASIQKARQDESFERSKQIMELVKNGDIDERIRKHHNDNGVPKILENYVGE
jgi:hypothetical protein